MSNIKITNPELKKIYGNNIISIGFCGGHNLLSGLEPRFYNCGLYGWNFDAYTIFNSKYGVVVITTGYRNLCGIRPNYNLLKEYETTAENIRNKYRWSGNYSDMRTELENNLNNFINAVLN